MEITNQVGNQGNITSIQKNNNNVKNIKNLKPGELAALEKLSPKEKSRTQFLEKFEKIKSESVKEELVKEFLNVATSNSHQFSNENFLDRKGRFRNYSTVKTIDRELETLTKDFINGQIDHMGVLKKMDDIRGMLLDIMM